MRVCTKVGGRDLGPEPTLEYWRYPHHSGEEYKRTALGQPRHVRWDRWSGRSSDYLHLALPLSRVSRVPAALRPDYGWQWHQGYRVRHLEPP